MKIKIEHTIEYSFSKPVFLEPHTIRLTPRHDRFQSVLSIRSVIDPAPAGISENLDVHGTLSHLAWFDGKTSSFKVHSVSEVDLVKKNPFDFLTYPAIDGKIPFQYPEVMVSELQASLLPLTNADVIRKLAGDLAKEADFEVVPFLTYCAQRIEKEYAYEKRLDGKPKSPLETYKSRQGSCRDFVVLFMAICRALGLAARFVSGYFYGGEDDEEGNELHAWVEVYIPGAGWRGFDPTYGIVCCGQHIALASSADPLLSAPVSGTFRGSAESTIRAEVELTGTSSEK